MDRAPAAWWLPAAVTGVSKRGIRMSDYLYPSSAAPPVQTLCAHRKLVWLEFQYMDCVLYFVLYAAGGWETGWTELLWRGGCLLPSLASQKGGYVCLTTFTRAPPHPLCNRTHTHTRHKLDLFGQRFLLSRLINGDAEKQRSRH